MKLVTKPEVTALDITNPASWDQARKYIQTSGKFEQCKLFCQAMAGIELRAIQKHEKLGAGGDKSKEKGTTFAELVQRELGISDRHARRLMEMGDLMRKKLRRFPELRDFSVLTLSVGDLGEEDSKLLKEAVRKITDGKTQSELLEELGIYKGSNRAGGGARDAVRDNVSTEDALRMQRDLATADWSHLGTLLRAYHSKFLVLDDAACQSQIAVLELHLSARRQWLSKPRAERLPEEVESYFASALQPVA